MGCCNGRCSLICLCALQLVSAPRAPNPHRSQPEDPPPSSLRGSAAAGASRPGGPGAPAGPRAPRRSRSHCPPAAGTHRRVASPRGRARSASRSRARGFTALPPGVATRSWGCCGGAGSELFPRPGGAQLALASSASLLKFHGRLPGSFFLRYFQ